MANQATLIQRLFSRIGGDSRMTKQDEMVDNFSRLVAGPLPRRHMLKFILMSLSGAAVTRLAGGSAQAQQASCCMGKKFDPSSQCCTSHGVQPKHPINDLAACPNRVEHPGNDPMPNGCGSGAFRAPNSWGQANFLPCCDSHDTCWGHCNNSRGGCDMTFHSCLMQACTVYQADHPIKYQLCLGVAQTYFNAVESSIGTGIYEDSQKMACDCCGSPGGQGACGSKGICCMQDQICVNGRCTDTSACAGAVCGSFTNCSVSDDCQCYTTAEGTGQCAHNELCAGLPHCTSSSQCGTGSICAVNTCCGAAGVCLPLCASNSLASKISVSEMAGGNGPTSSGKPLQR